MNLQENQLTIVVPAWKPDFLDAALQSIAAQSDQRFDVMVFDDAGPSEIAQIAQRYRHFKYFRFEKNLGGTNLIAHWNRCLAMIDTPWVWLFSDDDIMTEDCVTGFYEGLERAPEAKLFQFSVKQVDEALAPMHASPAVPHESVSDFIAARFRSAKISCVPDHIFNWHELKRLQSGFVEFPLAWNSDDATWVALARIAGVHGLPKGEVLWRQSEQNISSSSKNSLTKLKADVLYLNWLRAGGDIVSYLAVTRWLAARICYAYGFKSAEWGKIYRLLPLWLKPAAVLASLYPVVRQSKRLLK